MKLRNSSIFKTITAICISILYRCMLAVVGCFHHPLCVGAWFICCAHLRLGCMLSRKSGKTPAKGEMAKLQGTQTKVKGTG